MLRCRRKKGPRIQKRTRGPWRKRFAPRCFPVLLNTVSSPRGALTAVFGMGTGVTPPPEARTKGMARDRCFPPGALSRSRRLPPHSQARHGLLKSAPDARRTGHRGRMAPRPLGRSEAVWSTPRGACASALSNGWSSRGLRGPRGPGRLVSGGAWRLDAFSAYPFAAWPPGGALGRTAGTPEAARPRSSRTRGRSRQPSSARGG